MTGTATIPSIAFAPAARVSGMEMHAHAATQLPAAPASVARFEQLMFAPANAASAGSAGPARLSLDAGRSSSVRQYMESLSHRWQAGQNTLQQMTEAGNFTSRELVLTQIHMINCALDVEVSSKSAAMVENGVQTLTQRGG
jgi:hypothetical protein